MKNLILLIILLTAVTGSAQLDLFNATVTKNGATYTIRDTTGTADALTITESVLDSAAFVQQVFDQIYSGLRQASAAQVRAEILRRETDKYQGLLQGQGLLQAYMAYVDNIVILDGSWRVTYNGTSAVLNVGIDENLYTAGEVKVISVIQAADNLMKITLITQGNEVLDVHKVNDRIWWGTGNNGEFLMVRQ